MSMNKLLELDFYKDIINPINDKKYKTAELANILGVPVKQLKQFIKDNGFKWLGNSYIQDGNAKDYIKEAKLKKDTELNNNENNSNTSTKKDMIVNLDNHTIDIPEVGCISFNTIIDAYERIQQRIGIEAARDKGIHLGRPIENVPDEFIHYYNLVESKSISVVDAANQMGIGRATYYRYKKKHEESCNK